MLPDPHAFTSDGPYFRALDTYARKVTQQRDYYKTKLEHAKERWMSNHSHHDCAACDALIEAFSTTEDA